jgi:hypothetical protein
MPPLQSNLHVTMNISTKKVSNSHRMNRDMQLLTQKKQAKQQNISILSSTNVPSLSIAASPSVKSAMMDGANSTLSSRCRVRVMNSLSMTGVVMAIILLCHMVTLPMVCRFMLAHRTSKELEKEVLVYFGSSCRNNRPFVLISL